MKLTLILTAVSCLVLPLAASATSYSVGATDNIFGAGLSTPPAPGGGSAGSLPLQIGVTGIAYQFQYVSGTVSPDTSQSYSLDANGAPGFTFISCPGSISAYLSDNSFALLGVFLGSGGQSGPAPSPFDFTSTGTGVNFTTLSPQIGQVFFIGDGSNSSNQTQTFNVPTGATELYLGFADGVNFSGLVGQYQDNAGSLTMNVNAVPEPAPVVLIIAGSALMAVMRFRNKR
ncbi:MAG TPA: hypothetical protein VMH87_10440 [Pseudomonadales bacterium]|nr:hypothetical protein [Pseudomonadales bacterium]